MNIEDEIKLIIEELKNKKAFGESLSDDISPKPMISKSNEIELYKKDEIMFLNSVKERILILFEGLGNFDRGDIEARVELNLKFMEFLLATIDKRVEDISKF